MKIMKKLYLGVMAVSFYAVNYCEDCPYTDIDCAQCCKAGRFVSNECCRKCNNCYLWSDEACAECRDYPH